MNAGNNNNGMSTPEIIPYNEVAAIAVMPDIESARKKIIGSRNQVNVPNNRLPDEGNAISRIGSNGITFLFFLDVH